jgi:methylmalonyl-CoA/ethylmalonyl-CoA epimerase
MQNYLKKVLPESFNLAITTDFSDFVICPFMQKQHLMKKVEHIGIAVKKLADSLPLFEKLFNSPCYKTEVVDSEKVNTAFFRQGDTKIELLESTNPDGVVARFIEKKGEGLHHIAFEVDDIEKEMDRLKKEGFVLLNDKPKPGADNKLVCFLHPKHTNGVLIELCQERK